ncbi:MAG: type II secretion system F family protein, partial [Candidatus Hydrogenedentes bacterium]|nr:type II secretion system F family protein [Candidatus Hydrogenedentota bacterium]
MPTFSYSARDAAGKSHTGSLTVDTREALVSQLQQRGLTPTSIVESAGGRSGKRRATAAETGKSKKNPVYKIKSADLVVVTRQLATIVNAGLPLMQGLDILSEQSENVQVKKLLRQIAADVQAGESFSDALRKHPRAFSTLYV